MLKHINMIEIPGTSVEAKDPPAAKQFTALLAAKTAPVFRPEFDQDRVRIEMVVAVTYRDSTGKPVHGGLFGVTSDGVVSLALKDQEGVVRIGAKPDDAAFQLLFIRGPLVFNHGPVDYGIVDISAKDIDRACIGPHREAVKQAYLAEVLPHAAVEQPVAYA